MVNKKT